MADGDPVFRRVAAGTHADLLTIEREWDEKRKKLRGEIVVDDVRAVRVPAPDPGRGRLARRDRGRRGGPQPQRRQRAAQGAGGAAARAPAPAGVQRHRAGCCPPSAAAAARSRLQGAGRRRHGRRACPRAAGHARRRTRAAGGAGRRLARPGARRSPTAAPASPTWWPACSPACRTCRPSTRYAVADALGRTRKRSRRSWTCCVTGWPWPCATRRAAGRTRPGAAAGPRRLDAWVDVWHALTRLQRETEALHLDKRQALVSGFGCCGTASRLSHGPPRTPSSGTA